MKNRQNEQHKNSQERLTSLLRKEMPEANEVVRFDPSVFMKSKVILPDVSKQSMNSPQSTTSFSKESIIALVATNNIKRVFHSRTLSIASQIPPNEPSFALPNSSKASLANTNVIDISETGSNNDFQTTMYSSMVSNKKREISKLLIVPRQRTTSAQKHSPSLKSHKNSVELDLPQTERPNTAQHNTPSVQENYKKTLDSFFTFFDKNKTIEKPPNQQKRLLATFASQPASPVSRRADSLEKEKTKPQRPLAIKPTEPLNFGVLKLSETPISNRSKRNLKISTQSNNKPMTTSREPSPRNQSVEESSKGQESAKLQSSENISRPSSGVTSGTQSEIPSKKEEPSTISRLELPESQTKIGRKSSKTDVESKTLLRKNTIEKKGSKNFFKDEDNKVAKPESNQHLKIQPGSVVKLHKQGSIDLTLDASSNPTNSQRDIHKIRQLDAAKEANTNTNSMSNTVLSKQGTGESNPKNETSQIRAKRPIHDFLAETPKEPASANVPLGEGEKDKKMNDIRMARRSSFGEVFSLIQKQQQTRRNSSYRNLATLANGAGNLLQNLFPDSRNDKELEHIGTLKKQESFKDMSNIPAIPIKLKIALPSEDQPATQGGGTPKHGTPKHIKIITPHNLHIDLGLFSSALSPSHRKKAQKEENGNSPKKAINPINIELENQSSISSQYTNSPDASKSGFTPLVDSMTPSPAHDKNRLGLPRLSLNGLSPSFSDRSALLNNQGNNPEPVTKKGKKSFAQVCKQVIDIRRSHKSRTSDTQKDGGPRKSKENEVMSAGEKNKRRLSRTSEYIMTGLPSSPGGTVREHGSLRTSRVAEDYISGKKKVSFINKESTIRELSLLRSIIKDNEETTIQKERGSKKGSSIFAGGNWLKTPGESKGGPKATQSKSEPTSPLHSNSDIPSSVSSLQAPTSRSSISFKKPKFTKTYTQKSVFAKKKAETKKIQSNNFVVKFPGKEGEIESDLKLNFKSKEKRIAYHKTEVIRENFTPEGREDLSKVFLGNLNRTDRNKVSNLEKVRSENFVFSEGLDKQKTIDFSTLLQNDDDESLKAYPMKSISRSGSYRSDNSKLITLSARDRDRDRDNANCKMVIKIIAPNSEGNVNLLAKPKGANDEDLPEGCKKFEYITKSKRKKALDAEIEFSPFDGLDEMNDYVYNDDTYMGDSIEIAPGFKWIEHAKYFSKAEQHGRFLRFFDSLSYKNTPYFAKPFEDISKRYIKDNFNDDARTQKQIFNKKLVFRLINPISSKIQDIYRNEDDEAEVILFNSTLVGKYFDKTEIFLKSHECIEDFTDDIKDYNTNLLIDPRGVPYLLPKARRLLKGPHGHKHLLSQIDDRVQMKVFEEMRPTIEDYIMLNGVNMKEISRKEAYPQIAKVLEKTSQKNLDYISKLNFHSYRELFIGDFQCMLYLKSFDVKLLKNFKQDTSSNPKAMLSARKIIRNPSMMKLPPKRNSQSQEPPKKGASLLRAAVEKMNSERERMKLKLTGDVNESLDKNDLNDSSDTERSIIQSIKKKSKKLVPLSLKTPQAGNKFFSAPVSPNRITARDQNDQEDQLNNSRSSIFARTEGLKSPNSGGIMKKPIDTNEQPKSLLWKTITMNNAHLSHSPSRFKQVVIDVMKKNSKEKMKTLTNTEIPSMTKLNESRVSQQNPTPRKGSHHIKFDNTKTISTDETKMDKGALRMRTQAQTHTKKKNFNVSQQIFLAVQENREAELRELFVFCPLSLLDKTDEYGNNLLGIASQCGFTTVFNMLLDKGVNVNIPNANGDTPLHLALAYGNYEIADKLLALGARQNVQNKEGKYPWDLAR